ncbi:hypothetical protein [Sinorhizobium fredii]|uniref:hypothetical protein n=1 Tax=Rhizobium fredii TaxID=380 RepID=UPI000684FF51|nr:hypothetical protein [Sinorhizobium fredii]
MENATWRELITDALQGNEESWSDIVSITLSDAELDVEFDRGHGEVNGKPFTAWTTNYVYFPLCYDGAEWCGSAPRNPNGQALDHQGGREDALR